MGRYDDDPDVDEFGRYIPNSESRTTVPPSNPEKEVESASKKPRYDAPRSNFNYERRDSVGRSHGTSPRDFKTPPSRSGRRDSYSERGREPFNSRRESVPSRSNYNRPASRASIPNERVLTTDESRFIIESNKTVSNDISFPVLSFPSWFKEHRDSNKDTKSDNQEPVVQVIAAYDQYYNDFYNNLFSTFHKRNHLTPFFHEKYDPICYVKSRERSISASNAAQEEFIKALSAGTLFSYLGQGYSGSGLRLLPAPSVGPHAESDSIISKLLSTSCCSTLVFHGINSIISDDDIFESLSSFTSTTVEFPSELSRPSLRSDSYAGLLLANSKREPLIDSSLLEDAILRAQADFSTLLRPYLNLPYVSGLIGSSDETHSDPVENVSRKHGRDDTNGDVSSRMLSLLRFLHLDAAGLRERFFSSADRADSSSFRLPLPVSIQSSSSTRLPSTRLTRIVWIEYENIASAVLVRSLIALKRPIIRVSQSPTDSASGLSLLKRVKEIEKLAFPELTNPTASFTRWYTESSDTLRKIVPPPVLSEASDVIGTLSPLSESEIQSNSLLRSIQNSTYDQLLIDPFTSSSNVPGGQTLPVPLLHTLSTHQFDPSTNVLGEDSVPVTLAQFVSRAIMAADVTSGYEDRPNRAQVEQDFLARGYIYGRGSDVLSFAAFPSQAILDLRRALIISKELEGEHAAVGQALAAANTPTSAVEAPQDEGLEEAINDADNLNENEPETRVADVENEVENENESENQILFVVVPSESQVNDVVENAEFANTIINSQNSARITTPTGQEFPTTVRLKMPASCTSWTLFKHLFGLVDNNTSSNPTRAYPVNSKLTVVYSPYSLVALLDAAVAYLRHVFYYDYYRGIQGSSAGDLRLAVGDGYRRISTTSVVNNPPPLPTAPAPTPSPAAPTHSPSTDGVAEEGESTEKNPASTVLPNASSIVSTSGDTLDSRNLSQKAKQIYDTWKMKIHEKMKRRVGISKRIVHFINCGNKDAFKELFASFAPACIDPSVYTVVSGEASDTAAAPLINLSEELKNTVTAPPQKLLKPVPVKALYSLASVIHKHALALSMEVHPLLLLADALLLLIEPVDTSADATASSQVNANSSASTSVTADAAKVAALIRSTAILFAKLAGVPPEDLPPVNLKEVRLSEQVSPSTTAVGEDKNDTHSSKCLLCQKTFMGPQFTLKHILNKHSALAVSAFTNSRQLLVTGTSQLLSDAWVARKRFFSDHTRPVMPHSQKVLKRCLKNTLDAISDLKHSKVTVSVFEEQLLTLCDPACSFVAPPLPPSAASSTEEGAAAPSGGSGLYGVWRTAVGHVHPCSLLRQSLISGNIVAARAVLRAVLPHLDGDNLARAGFKGFYQGPVVGGRAASGVGGTGQRQSRAAIKHGFLGSMPVNGLHWTPNTIGIGLPPSRGVIGPYVPHIRPDVAVSGMSTNVQFFAGTGRRGREGLMSQGTRMAANAFIPASPGPVMTQSMLAQQPPPPPAPVYNDRDNVTAQPTVQVDYTKHIISYDDI